MKSLFLLCALTVALLGAECDKSQKPVTSTDQSSRATTAFATEDESFAAPIPEPSGALIFGLGLAIGGFIYGTWMGNKR